MTTHETSAPADGRGPIDKPSQIGRRGLLGAFAAMLPATALATSSLPGVAAARDEASFPKALIDQFLRVREISVSLRQKGREHPELCDPTHDDELDANEDA